MATWQARIDEFDHEGSPPQDQPLEILCEDHVGTYVIPFPCQWSDGAWQNAETRRPIEAAVIGWREAKRNQCWTYGCKDCQIWVTEAKELWVTEAKEPWYDSSEPAAATVNVKRWYASVVGLRS
jgi:hypothetical protein